MCIRDSTVTVDGITITVDKAGLVWEDGAEDNELTKEMCIRDRAYIYNINGGSTAKNATNTYATAKYPGAGGNNFSIKIEAIAGDDTNYRVSTLLAGVALDEQIAVSYTHLDVYKRQVSIRIRITRRYMKCKRDPA